MADFVGQKATVVVEEVTRNSVVGVIKTINENEVVVEVESRGKTRLESYPRSRVAKISTMSTEEASA